MADDQLIVTVQRLGNDLRELKSLLRKNYSKSSQQVTAVGLKRKSSAIAEVWLADLSQRPALTALVSAEYLGDLGIHFQRLLVCAERATIRSRYDDEIRAILKKYTTDLVIPLMQGAGRPRPGPTNEERSSGGLSLPGRADAEGFRPTAFVGHSFAPEDAIIVESVIGGLEAMGITVATGQRPKADRISEKVKKQIEGQHLFVGIFTRRDKLVGKKNKWSTSPWVIDEKAYAIAGNRKLILLKEDCVESIGGIQGDYEFIEFSRDQLEEVIIPLLQVFKLSVQGLR